MKKVDKEYLHNFLIPSEMEELEKRGVEIDGVKNKVFGYVGTTIILTIYKGRKFVKLCKATEEFEITCAECQG